jgi:Tfp pilus assembly protein PilN
MIRTNLSTRPFYNARAVRALVGLFAVIVVAMTAYNTIELVRLSGSQRTLGAKASANEREATRLRTEAARILAKVDTKELAAVDKAAREANAIIDQRTFSWTDVFSHFERTLPQDVRITSVSQQAARQVVVIKADARSVDDVDRFIEALEKTGAFRDVTPRNEVLMDNDIIDATLEATYTPRARPTEKRP